MLREAGLWLLAEWPWQCAGLGAERPVHKTTKLRACDSMAALGRAGSRPVRQQGRQSHRAPISCAALMQAAAAAVPGSKPGPAGTRLISTGLADLDLLLGKGLPLGSLLLLLEAEGCSQPLTLLQYFLAEGVASGQDALWLGPDAPGELGLPRLAADQRAPKASPAGAAGVVLWCSSETALLQAAKPGKAASGLRIAWQYRDYLAPAGEAAEFDPGANREQLRCLLLACTAVRQLTSTSYLTASR